MRDLLKNKLYRNILLGIVGLAVILTITYVLVDRYQKQNSGLNKVLAVVGGEKIRQIDLNKKVYATNFYGSVSSPAKISDEEKNVWIKTLTEEAIIKLKAKELGISVSDDEISAEIKNRKINYDGFTADQKNVTREEIVNKKLKDKVINKITSWKSGSYVFFRYDKYFDDYDVSKVEGRGDVSLITKQKEYATALANSEYDSLSKKTKTLEQISESMLADSTIGAAAYLPLTPNFTGEFGQGQYLADDEYFDTTAYRGLKENIRSLKNGETSKPFILERKYKDGYKDFTYAIAKITGSGEGTIDNYDKWLESENKRLTSGLSDKLKVSFVNKAEAHNASWDCPAVNYSNSERVRLALKIVYRTPTGGFTGYDNVPVRETGGAGSSNPSLRKCDSSTLNGFTFYAAARKSNANWDSWAVSSDGEYSGDGFGGTTDYRNVVECAITSTANWYLPDSPPAIPNASGGSWELVTTSSRPEITSVSLDPNYLKDLDTSTAGLQAWPSDKSDYAGSYTKSVYLDLNRVGGPANGTNVDHAVIWNPNWKPDPGRVGVKASWNTYSSDDSYDWVQNSIAGSPSYSVPPANGYIKFKVDASDANGDNVRTAIRVQYRHKADADGTQPAWADARGGDTTAGAAGPSGYATMWNNGGNWGNSDWGAAWSGFYNSNSSDSYGTVKATADTEYRYAVYAYDNRNPATLSAEPDCPNADLGCEATPWGYFRINGNAPTPVQVSPANGATVPVGSTIDFRTKGIDLDANNFGSERVCTRVLYKKVGTTQWKPLKSDGTTMDDALWWWWPYTNTSTYNDRLDNCVASNSEHSNGTYATNLPAGVYEWKARAIDRHGVVGPETGIWNFTVEDNLALNVTVVGKGRIKDSSQAKVPFQFIKKAYAAILNPLILDCDNRVTGGTKSCTQTGYQNTNQATMVPEPAFGWQFAGWTITGAQKIENDGADGKKVTFGSEPINATATFTEITLSCVSLQAVPASSGVLPLTVTFTANTQYGTVPNSYRWNFGDGSAETTTTTNTTTHTYTTNDTPTASVVVSDSKTPVQGTCTLTLPITVSPWSTNQQREVAP